jgi:hypothetical protein
VIVCEPVIASPSPAYRPAPADGPALSMAGDRPMDNTPIERLHTFSASPNTAGNIHSEQPEEAIMRRTSSIRTRIALVAAAAAAAAGFLGGTAAQADAGPKAPPSTSTTASASASNDNTPWG